MKSVLISTRPKWCEKICHEIGKEEAGKAIYEKRIEVRKTAPKEVPFKAYIYETKESKMRYLNDRFNSFLKNKSHYTDMGKVIGEFICDKVYNLVNAFGGIMFADENLNQLEPQLFRDMSCLTDEQTADYLGDKDGYGWHISDLKIYDKPKELSEFCIPCKVSCENCKNPLYFECWCEEKGKKIVTRPPQSWCYVEELCKAQN
jgi:hypothetical protein